MCDVAIEEERFKLTLRDLVLSEIGRGDRASDWSENLSVAQFVDGTPLGEGPVVIFRSANLKRSIRITQMSPSADLLRVSAWMMLYDDLYDDDLADLEELVISCDLSEDSISITGELVAFWVDPNTEYDEMAQRIDVVLE